MINKITAMSSAWVILKLGRWAVRSLLRPSGATYRRQMAGGVTMPVLQLHGALDTCTLPTTAHGSGAYAHGGYELLVLDGVGHFVQQEAADLVSGLLVAHAGA